MTTIAPTTELDAVNEMLAALGESPVTTLSGTLPQDVTIARQILDRTSREVQARGFWFNRETGVELTPDGSSNLLLADAIIKVDSPYKDVVERSVGGVRMLYDRGTNLYTFTAPLKVDLVRLFDFAAIPESARRYITVVAARRFQNRFLGDRDAAAYTKDDELEAKAELLSDECENDDANMLQTEPFISIASFRRRTY